jgi:Fe-S cluster assembly iron-binding protein IscA
LDIIVTGAATEKAKEFLRRSGRVDDKGNPLCGLRLHFKGSDAFGVKYVFSVDCNAPRQNDKVIESYGFTYTFSTPNVYAYVCTAPCGPGMGLKGYMLGYLTVT